MKDFKTILLKIWHCAGKLNWNFYFWGLFLVLVALGVTGSSLGWYRQLPGSAAVVELVGERKLFGVYRGIRGDEFIAHATPNALRQYLHDPPFPRTNYNVGLSGRDDLVLHDTGAPVRHFSMISRPATWGFFLFDLRRALAWYWLFPIFFGLWGVFFLFETLFPEQRKVNFLLAAATVFSPYCAAWSFWPINNIGGLCVAAGAFLRLLRAETKKKQCVLAILAGWGASVSALSIYFPRIWPTAVLLGLVVLARICSEALWQRFRNPFRMAMLLLAALVLTGILGGWYLAAADTIDAVRRLVYPGMRRLNGGSMDWWEMMVGWLAPFTIYKINFKNQSEMQASLSLLFPFLLYVIVYFQSLKRQTLFWALAGCWLVFLTYQHIGFPGWLAEITLFDLCSPPRCGIALVLTQFLMIGLFYSLRKREDAAECLGQKMPQPIHTPLQWGGVLLWSLLIPALLLWGAPTALWQGLRPWFSPTAMLLIGGMIVVVYGACVFLLFKKIVWFIGLFCAFHIFLGALFNPICIAPYKIENDLAHRLAAASWLHHQGRVLFITENDFLAVAHLLSGGRALNGYFMYQDQGVFDLFFAGMKNAGAFWRMNHLDAVATPPGSELFTATIPHGDRIVLHFNGAAYDFAQLPIDVLAATKQYCEYLDLNPSLTFWYERDGLRFYRIRPRPGQ